MSGRKHEIGTRQASCCPFLSIRKDIPPRETSSSTSPGLLLKAIIGSDLNSINIVLSGALLRLAIALSAEILHTWPTTSLNVESQK